MVKSLDLKYQEFNKKMIWKAIGNFLLKFNVEIIFVESKYALRNNKLRKEMRKSVAYSKRVKPHYLRQIIRKKYVRNKLY